MIRKHKGPDGQITEYEVTENDLAYEWDAISRCPMCRAYVKTIATCTGKDEEEVRKMLEDTWKAVAVER